MFEFSLGSFGYDDYESEWAWTPRLRLNIPIWESGAIFTDFGIHCGYNALDEYMQLGVQWICTDWGYLDVYVRYITDFSMLDYGYAISVGVAFGFSSGY